MKDDDHRLLSMKWERNEIFKEENGFWLTTRGANLSGAAENLEK